MIIYIPCYNVIYVNHVRHPNRNHTFILPGANNRRWCGKQKEKTIKNRNNANSLSTNIVRNVISTVPDPPSPFIIRKDVFNYKQSLTNIPTETEHIIDIKRAKIKSFNPASTKYISLSELQHYIRWVRSNN